MIFTVATSEKENFKKKKEKESIKIPSRCVHLITTTENFSIKTKIREASVGENYIFL